MLTIAGVQLESRFLLGSANYPSPQILQKSIEASSTEIITVSIKRQSPGGSTNPFWDLLRQSNCHLLPNTAGCFSASDAITTAKMSQELFNTNWIKLEVIGDDYTLAPNPFELIKATETLIKEGFVVFPYCSDDLVLCQELVNLGCKVLMPWGSMIGSGRGLQNPYALELLRERFPDIVLIVDAGIGRPSHALSAMEYGYDGVLLNTAVAEALDPVSMSRAFAKAIEAGRLAFKAGLITKRLSAKPSTPLIGKPFWQLERQYE